MSLGKESAIATFHGLSSESHCPPEHAILRRAKEVDESEKRRDELRLVNEELTWNDRHPYFEEVVRKQTGQFEFSCQNDWKVKKTICDNCGEGHKADTCDRKSCDPHLYIKKQSGTRAFSEK